MRPNRSSSRRERPAKYLRWLADLLDRVANRIDPQTPAACLHKMRRVAADSGSRAIVRCIHCGVQERDDLHGGLR